MGARGCECGSDGAKRSRARSAPAPFPRSLVPPHPGHPFGPAQRVGPAGGAGRAAGGSAGLRHLLAAAHGGRVGGWRRRGTPPLLSPSVQRDVLPGGTIIQDWQPYRPSESNLSLLVAKGLEWRVNSRARPRLLTLGTRPFPIPPGGNGTWRYVNIYTFVSEGAQVQSQLLWHLQRQAPRLVHLNVMCQLFLAPQLWLQLADFCQAGLGLELVKGYTEQYLLEADI